MKINTLVFFTVLLISFFAVAEVDFAKEEIKINKLLDLIEKSGATFIRNGEERSGKDAKEHLQYKVKMAKRMFFFFGPERKVTIKEFIDEIASKSYISKEPYMIRLKPGEAPRPASEWLHEQRVEIEKEEENWRSQEELNL